MKPRRPGDCIDGVRFLKLRGNNSGLSSCVPRRTSQSAVQGVFWRQAQVQETALQAVQTQVQE
eukprot:4937879-Pleurochrysis_carterae.AAC.1